MAFDEDLAARVRERLARTRGVEEKRMFGGVCFLLGGHILAGVWKDSLLVRLGRDEAEAALREPHVGVFGITGKAMTGWVLVAPEGVEDDGPLADGIDRARAFVETLPAKS